MVFTAETTMGGDGRIAVPQELQARQQWKHGDILLLIDTPHGVFLASQEQAKYLVRQQLAGARLVDDLLSERRAEASWDGL